MLAVYIEVADVAREKYPFITIYCKIELCVIEMKKQNKSHTKPTLQSFILADHVYMDAFTNKKVIAGTFDNIVAKSFPSNLDRTSSAYLRILNCRRGVKIQLRYVDLKDDNVLRESSEIPLNNARGPLESHELIVEVPPLPVPHPGVYELSAYCDGEFLGRIKITVSEMSRKTTERE